MLSFPYGPKMMYFLLICIAAILESVWWIPTQPNVLQKKIIFGCVGIYHTDSKFPYCITLLWSSTSRHFVNKITHSNSGLTKVLGQMRKKYFQIDAFWKLIFKYSLSLINYFLICFESSECKFVYSENWLRLTNVLPVPFLFEIGYFDKISLNK